jgi:CO/xanthine dehydrogenase Mo-binding subunit/aerobic-type carbon monoxide dehydrogenase small subunit (CoxS/CutS family)
VPRLVVNGEPAELDLDPATPLVLALRDGLGLRGVRAGCGIGECGACVVLVDGEPIRSCRTPVSAVAGGSVTTPEGLGTPAAPHPVQQAFLAEQAGQCGYCVNGMTMTVAGLLARDPAPGEPAIQAALAGHLCRCGAHHRILRAVRRLAGREPPPVPPVRPLGPAVDPAAPDPPAPDPPPRALAAAPRVEQWLRPLPDGRVEARSGRVELGQGVRTALAQIVAAELDLPVDRVVVRSAATDTGPDEGYTAGSASLQQGGATLARAAAGYRRLREQGRPPVGPIRDQDRPRWRGGPIGAPVPRTDLVEKLTGAPGYLHDLALPRMVHARALLSPTYQARPATLDLAAVRAMPGVLATVHDGGLVLVVGEGAGQVTAAVERLAAATRWHHPGPPEPADREPASIRPAGTGPAGTGPVGEAVTVVADPAVAVALAVGRRVCASYIKPYESHGSFAPSCAVALAEPDRLTVWTHSQGVFPLRRELAALLGEAESRLTVRHLDGPGCYGQNLADDAAGFAALAARAVPGRPVRFQFTVHDEFGWEPYGPAMAADLEAALDPAGRITAWRHRIRTGPHTARPYGSGDRLMAAWLRTGGPPRPWTGGGEGGVRNAVPIYQLPAREIGADYLRTRLRTGSLRSLGAYFNVFAIESFMDELAAAAGADPLAFRLAHLRDGRARAVLELAAEVAEWRQAGQGLAVARYKGTAAYVAQVASVTADPGSGVVRVVRVVTVCDAGVVVNPDGLRNQLEGGTLQGLSRALHEQIRYGPAGIESRDWTSYPVLRFAEVPELVTILVDRPGGPPLGAGEAATPVAAAALANAVAAATGARVRELPLAPDRAGDPAHPPARPG